MDKSKNATELAKNEKEVYTKSTKQTYKDSLFTRIFSMPEHFKSVYGAILGKDISDKEVILFNNDPMLTVDIRNDVAMLYEGRIIVFIEHQSTINLNMPVRMLWYTSAAFKMHMGDQLRMIFGTKQIKLPRPEFYVFYAGEKHWDKTHLKLSDCYENLGDEEPMLDLHVKVINMRDKNHPVMKKCQEAHIYIELIEKIEKLIATGKTRDEAIHEALSDIAKEENPLHDFLRKCESEVENMIKYQLTLEEVAYHAQRIREQEVFEEGAHEKAIETAKKLTEMGLPLDQILIATGLKKEELHSICNS